MINKDRNRNRLFKRDGQATLEFILIIPILIVLVLAVSQIGYLIYTQNIIEQLSREGARTISTSNDNQKCIETIMNSGKHFDSEKMEIEIIPGSPDSRGIGDLVQVVLSYRTTGIAGLILEISGGKKILSARSMMRMECHLPKK